MDITIVIPTKNGGEILSKVLDEVFAQKTQYEYEVVCVDSGSSDNTVGIIKSFPCKLYQIEPSEFGHGKTRNYGASKGSGEYIVFLTQDAVPASRDWLENFITDMKNSPDAVCGFGRHLPYPDCNELDKRDIINHFKGFGDKPTTYWMQDKNKYYSEEWYRHFLAFFSDNNSCLKRSIWEKYPYPDVNFSEDQIWMKRMIELGYKKVYAQDAVVYHSHNYDLGTYYKRYFDEFKGIYQIHKYQMFHTRKGMWLGTLRMIKSDLQYIWNRDNEIKNRIYWSYYAVRRDRYKCKAGYLAGNYTSYPEVVRDYLDRHISQQHDQIYDKGNDENMKKSNIKEWLKWIFLEPHEEHQWDQVDVFKQYGYILGGTKTAFSMDDYNARDTSRFTLNWVVPEMGVGSGGHLNIFRFVMKLEGLGIHNRVYLNHPVNFKSDVEIQDFLSKYFGVDTGKVEVYQNASFMKYADGVVATSWDTAYTIRDFDNTISKFYFVQDYEPLFYAVGSQYAFAENTYRFGFRGITAGDWLKDLLNEKYGMKTNSFLFSYDKDTYYPAEKKDNKKRLFFYARPVTPRRDFELGLLALKRTAELVPDVEVVFAGWDVSNYRIDFQHVNKGTISDMRELSELYSQCDMCLVISGTNLSLLPLEVMASGSVPVCTKGANSEWLVNESNSIMVDFDPNEIANTIAYYFNHEEELAKKRMAGIEYSRNSSWDVEAKKVYDAVVDGIEEDRKAKNL